VRFRVSILIALLLCCSNGLQAQQTESEPSETQLQLEQVLDSAQAEIQGEAVVAQALLREIYAAKAYRPIWTDERKIRELITLLNDSVDYGLLPRDYHLNAIERLSTLIARSPNPAAVAARDILLTEGLMLYSYHRRFGKVKASDLYPEFNFTREPFSAESPVGFIDRAFGYENLNAFIKDTTPTADYYESLRAQLKRYRQLEASGGWPDIPGGPTLRKDDRDQRVALLRRRLEVTGELPRSATPDETLFDESVEQAVKTFQSLHGLQTDGLVGKQTMGAMNVPVNMRIDQLRLSLERLRWVAEDAGDEFIAVNIAGFRLSYMKQREVVWTTRVMVGTSYRKTPVFRSELP